MSRVACSNMVIFHCATLCELVVAQPAAGDSQSPAAPFMVRLWVWASKHPRQIIAGRGVNQFDQSKTASRAGSTCGARTLPLPPVCGGGLYSGQGALIPPARHGSAYRGAVLARESGPRSSLLRLRSAFAGRNCGVAA